MTSVDATIAAIAALAPDHIHSDTRTKAETMARRYRIWSFCNSREWDVTLEEIATATGYSALSVMSTISHTKWGGRIRWTTNGQIGNYSKLANPTEDAACIMDIVGRV